MDLDLGSTSEAMSERTAWRIVFALAVIAIFFLGGLAATVRDTHNRRAQNRETICSTKQSSYDAETFIVGFIAFELRATPTQTAAAFKDLEGRIGQRPNC